MAAPGGAGALCTRRAAHILYDIGIALPVGRRAAADDAMVV